MDSDGDFKVRSGGKLALVRQGNSVGYKLPSADMQIKAVEERWLLSSLLKSSVKGRFNRELFPSWRS